MEDFEGLVISKKELNKFYLNEKQYEIEVDRYKLKNMKGFYYKVDIYEKRGHDRQHPYKYRGSTGYQCNTLGEVKKKLKKMLRV
jgi:hypothetical protein